MRRITSGSNTVRGAFDKLYEEARKKRETIYMEINGFIFLVFPEDALRFPELQNTEEYALIQELERRGKVVVDKKELEGLKAEELNWFIDRQSQDLKEWILNHTKSIKEK